MLKLFFEADVERSEEGAVQRDDGQFGALLDHDVDMQGVQKAREERQQTEKRQQSRAEDLVGRLGRTERAQKQNHREAARHAQRQEFSQAMIGGDEGHVMAGELMDGQTVVQQRHGVEQARRPIDARPGDPEEPPGEHGAQHELAIVEQFAQTAVGPQG